MKYYYNNNYKFQDFLEEHGVVPIEYRGETAIYKADSNFLSLLDLYYIKHNCCHTHI